MINRLLVTIFLIISFTYISAIFAADNELIDLQNKENIGDLASTQPENYNTADSKGDLSSAGDTDIVDLQNKENIGEAAAEGETSSQETTSKIKTEIYGFVEYDAFLDSRQNLDSRDGFILYYPLAKRFDKCGRDINARPSFNMSVAQSRVGLNLSGPKVFRAKCTARIESDFLGINSDTLGECRLRYSFINFEWDTSSLRIGKFLHPIAPDEVIADTLAGDSGGPISPFARIPQIRYLKKFGGLELGGALSSQIFPFSNNGPEGFSSIYLRNAVVPNITGEIRYHATDQLYGIVIDYLRLAPRIQTDKCYKAHEFISSVAYGAYAVIKFCPVRFTTQIVYGPARDAWGILGGYAVSTIDPLTDRRTYTNISSLTWWTDLESTNTKVVPGLYLGILKNLGSRNKLYFDPATNQPITYLFSEDFNIAYVWRVSPRIWWNKGPFRIGAEIEVTGAAFGCIGCYGEISNAVPVTNIRGQISAFYFF